MGSGEGAKTTNLGGEVMPVHDWTRVEAGILHHFRNGWITEIGNALNGGLLPPGYLARIVHGDVGRNKQLRTLPELRSP
jgi:hypothetical protein